MEPDETIGFRPAKRDDLEVIVALLAHDELGQTRESQRADLDPAYIAAFDAIERDLGNEVIVGEDASGIFGTMQLSYIPNLTFQGATRCQIEGVRITGRVRGQGWAVI